MQRLLVLVALTLLGQAFASDVSSQAPAERRLPSSEYQRRVNVVRSVPGFVALWDFVKRDDGAAGSARFAAHQAAGDTHDFSLDAINYVREYWNEGRAATYADFPVLGRGPFGQAIRVKHEPDVDFRPCLLLPRARLHGSGLDAQGPQRSVSMLAWVIRESGNHAVAGIWHEGTDLEIAGRTAATVERGRRQYAIFAGLAANVGASAVHVSENGGSSFGDRYARNLAVTPDLVTAVRGEDFDTRPEVLDRSWHVMGFTFDNATDTVTAYLDGEARDYWIERPFDHPFFKWPARAWQQAELRRVSGVQPEEDPSFPPEQLYQPPEAEPLVRTIVSETDDERVELVRFAFTEVRVTTRKRVGESPEVVRRELVQLRANPFWFGHDLYAPARPEDGGPFTIGRVIHSSRNVGFTGYIGGVAVFSGALSPADMKRLSAVAEGGPIPLPGER